MGICNYCGNPAGFLRTRHKECALKFKSGNDEILRLVETSLKDNSSLDGLVKKINGIAAESYIQSNMLPSLLRTGWHSAVDKAFEDDILTEDEERRLSSMITAFGFNKDEMNEDPAYLKVVKGAVLRDVLNGKVPDRMGVTGPLPFNFLKTEKLVWLFRDVQFHEMRTYKRYTGGYQGFSIRVMKGVYYRAGGFRGNPVERSQMAHVDTGILGVTTRHLYFTGASKSFRVKYEKIVSFQPYSDGIGIQRDAQTARPQVFITGDGWFTYNLVVNLTKG
jgi:hypothetical protein